MNKKLKYALLLVLLTPSIVNCAGHMYTGPAAHSPRLDGPEHYAPNPIGIVRWEYNVGEQCTPARWTFYLEHQSSIPYTEQGYGLNTGGVLRRIGR